MLRVGFAERFLGSVLEVDMAGLNDVRQGCGRAMRSQLQMSWIRLSAL